MFKNVHRSTFCVNLRTNQKVITSFILFLTVSILERSCSSKMLISSAFYSSGFTLMGSTGIQEDYYGASDSCVAIIFMFYSTETIALLAMRIIPVSPGSVQKVLRDINSHAIGANHQSHLTTLSSYKDYVIWTSLSLLLSCRVCCMYEGLCGTASESTEFVTLASKPSCPRPPNVFARTKSTLSVRWAVPVDNGAKITSYCLQYATITKGGVSRFTIT